jgi:hypothetical protein
VYDPQPGTNQDDVAGRIGLHPDGGLVLGGTTTVPASGGGALQVAAVMRVRSWLPYLSGFEPGSLVDRSGVEPQP